MSVLAELAALAFGVLAIAAAAWLAPFRRRWRVGFVARMTASHLRSVVRVLRGRCPCGCALMGPGFRIRLLWDHPRRDGYRPGFRGERV